MTLLVNTIDIEPTDTGLETRSKCVRVVMSVVSFAVYGVRNSWQIFGGKSLVGGKEGAEGGGNYESFVYCLCFLQF